MRESSNDVDRRNPSAALPGYYDRQGQPMSLGTWAQLIEKGMDYKRVAQTTVGPYWISTVWLGLDHSFWDGPPLIFETMVLLADDGPANEYDVVRYSTEAEALAGHDEMVTLVRATTPTETGEDPEVST